MVLIEINERVRKIYPSAIFGSLIITNIKNSKSNPLLNDLKNELEKEIQANEKNLVNDPILELYKSYFKKWNKSYPIDYQIKSVLKGKSFPEVSILVDSMFNAEIKNRILTSGHDLDEIVGNLEFDISTGSEDYTKIDGNLQLLKKDDIFLKDSKGILANILYGPSKRSTINLKTKNALFLAWSPIGIDEPIVKLHLQDLLSNLELIYGQLHSHLTLIGSKKSH